MECLHIARPDLRQSKIASRNVMHAGSYLKLGKQSALVVGSLVGRNEPSDGYGDVQNTRGRFQSGKHACGGTDRNDVAIAQGRQGHQAEVQEGSPGNVLNRGIAQTDLEKGMRVQNVDQVVDREPKHSQDQVQADRRVDSTAGDGACAAKINEQTD